MAIKDSKGKGFKNKGAFGTRAHKHLERMIASYEPLPDLTIRAEAYVEEGSEKKKIKKGRFPKGALSVDIDIEYRGKHVLGIDLKTGKGWSKKGIEARRKRFGDNIVQIFFDVSGK